MIDTSFLDQLSRFNLIINKRVTSKYSGSRKSFAMGRGAIFKDHRIYSPGDDFRAIDWKLYGRTDDLHVRLFEEERSLIVQTLIDSSASMGFGEGITKYDYASMLGVGFGYLALKENEKFKFCTFSDKLNYYESKRGKAQLAAMVDHLNRLEPSGGSDFKSSISAYKKIMGSRSFVVLISDFLSNIEDIRYSLHLLSKHDVKVVQVLDPVEKDLLLNGDFKLSDMETGEKMRTFVSPRLKVSYQEALYNHISKLQDACRDSGASFNSVTTDKPVFDSFYEVLKTV